ncbi:CDP-glucose 4,6-dehydratase [Catenovulum sp. SM1970]|uniref:CDP-glucose 4,6-dehydratase n=1 Tax=Marinifaba aquimaris TaxID=2741323 RepID=UPI001573D3AD|nr:CDP-glucose 4,6-dehydratase [Marinifaba aquimaris]NTS75353.1 CDP-glucose 4,6-dehydratase [Marinifaba aquimaris]
MKLSFWKDKKVLITGNTGFKGCWLSALLNRLGATTYGYSLENDRSEPNLFDFGGTGKTDFYRFGDVANYEMLESYLDEVQPDIVFHLAAQPLVRKSYIKPVDTYQTNVIGTINLLDIARKVDSIKALVNVTTDKCYANNDLGKSFVESDSLGGNDPYSASKACSEIITHSYQTSFFADSHCAIASARAGNVIGGGDWSEDRLLPDIFRSLYNNEKIVIRNPSYTRPWQHVLDPLFGYLLLAHQLFVEGNKFSGGWNFGPERSEVASVLDVVEKTLAVMGKSKAMIELEGTAGLKESILLSLDSQKAEHYLNWKGAYNTEQAIELTASLYSAWLEKDKTRFHSIWLHQIDDYIKLRFEN